MHQQETANQIAKELSLLPSETKASQPLRLPPAGPLNCFSRRGNSGRNSGNLKLSIMVSLLHVLANQSDTSQESRD